MLIESETTDNVTFITPSGEELPVRNLPKDLAKLRYDTMYPIGNYLYRFYGQMGRETRKYRERPGSILKMGDIFMVTNFEDATDTERDIFSVRNCILDGENDDTSIDDMIDTYILNYKMKNNLIAGNRKKLLNSGEVYVPELRDTDDALTRIMNLMIIHKEVVLNNYRDHFDKKYSLDNMRSSINMTITRFLAWCELLDLEWEFTLEDNGTDIRNPLLFPLTISSKQDLNVEWEEPLNNIFRVKPVEGEDPLKRLIKVCIYEKNIVLSEYKSKGSTPHLINNMRSALKRDSRMMFPYFVYWCEVLGVDYILKVIDPEDGHVETAGVDYKATDYRVKSRRNDDEGE